MGLFGNSAEKKARKAYENKLREARDAQRKGEIPEYARLMAEAEAMHRELQALVKAS